jgi:hypothetical protein
MSPPAPFPPYSQRRSAPRPLSGRIWEVPEAWDGLLNDVQWNPERHRPSPPLRFRCEIRKEKLPDLQGLGWVREKRAIIGEGTTIVKAARTVSIAGVTSFNAASFSARHASASFRDVHPRSRTAFIPAIYASKSALILARLGAISSTTR